MTPEPKRLVRLIFALKRVQSTAERAPVVVEDARERERDCPERVSPFAVARVTASCV